jgi:hypothetical protein
VPVALEGQCGDGVGALLLSDGGHVEESIPQGDPRLKPRATSPNPGAKAPFSLWVLERAKPKGLAYLEAGSRFARIPTHAMRLHEWGIRR